MAYSLFGFERENTVFPESDIYLNAIMKRGERVYFPVGDRIQNGNTLVVGTTRTGKTEFIRNMAAGLRNAYPDELFVFMDVKQDYIGDRRLYKPDDYVVSCANMNGSYRQFQWSLIEESLRSKNPYFEIKEMIALLFETLPDQGQNQIFVESARLAFSAFLNVFVYQMVNSRKRFAAEDVPSNQEWVALYNNMDFQSKRNWIKCMPSQIVLCDEVLPVLEDGRPTKYAESVLSIIRVFISLFEGNFCGKGIDSIQGFLCQRGKAMFLEFDYDRQRSTSAFFRMFLKKLIQKKMAGDSPHRDRKLYLVLDESMVVKGDFDLVNALNVGAGDGLRIILACQSIDHLYMQAPKEFNDHYGQASIAGFSNVICFRPADGNTAKTIQEKFGKADIEKMVMPVDRYQPAQMMVNTEYIVNSEQLMSLGVGDAYVKLKAAKPVRVHFDKEDLV